MKYLLCLLSVLFSLPAVAGDTLNDSDVGTYVVLDRSGTPTEMFYRLSRQNGGWSVDGKIPGQDWAIISCDSGCEYHDSGEAEIKAYFPSDWLANADIRCIQNAAQAFCRYSAKEDASKSGNLIVSFVTGQPIPMFVRRIHS